MTNAAVSKIAVMQYRMVCILVSLDGCIIVIKKDFEKPSKKRVGCQRFLAPTIRPLTIEDFLIFTTV